MAVYVDEIADYSLIAKARGLRHTHWCHLTGDTEGELHAFVGRLGLKRSWYQRKGPQDYRWHYDITPPKRARAIELGAVEIGRDDVAALMDARRGAAGLEPLGAAFARALGRRPPAEGGDASRLPPPTPPPPPPARGGDTRR